MVSVLAPGEPGVIENSDGLRLTGQRVPTEAATGPVLAAWLQATVEGGGVVRVVDAGTLPEGSRRTGHRMHVVLGPAGALRCGEVWAVAVDGAVSLREATTPLLGWPGVADEASRLLASGER